LKVTLCEWGDGIPETVPILKHRGLHCRGCRGRRYPGSVLSAPEHAVRRTTLPSCHVFANVRARSRGAGGDDCVTGPPVHFDNSYRCPRRGNCPEVACLDVDRSGNAPSRPSSPCSQWHHQPQNPRKPLNSHPARDNRLYSIVSDLVAVLAAVVGVDRGWDWVSCRDCGRGRNGDRGRNYPGRRCQNHDLSISDKS
jgi:hypothetical protein